jgi:hypothetical protein
VLLGLVSGDALLLPGLLSPMPVSVEKTVIRPPDFVQPLCGPPSVREVRALQILAMDGTRMLIDFILLLVDIALTFLEHLFHHGVPSRKGKVRKSLERRKAQRSEDPES